MEDKKKKERRPRKHVQKAEVTAGLEKRQRPDPDEFEEFYKSERLLRPEYDFSNLYQIYEESDILQSCIDAYKQNIDGFGYQMQFLGDDVEQKESSLAKAEYVKCKDYFDSANETESWMTLRKKVREDLEVLGNGAMEVLRNKLGAAQLYYHLPFTRMRVSSSDGRHVTITKKIRRDGKVAKIRIKKYFRKWCQMSRDGNNLVWFKSFGDPRVMDATDGFFKKEAECKVVASEVIHWKLDMAGWSYGIPRWMGTVAEVSGRRSAQYINYDLFENQGIPPMAVLVSGGALTDPSLAELDAVMEQLRSPENWNKVLLLESNLEGVGLDDKGSAKIELKNLTDYRKEDMMFDTYLKNTEKNVRHRFRLPPLYVGGAETFTHATAKAAQTIAEEQVFSPERYHFDETVNKQIVQEELGVTMWRYRSKGPRIVGAEDITRGMDSFAAAGAMTVNHAIERANEAFGTEMSKYKDPWADYPIAFVLELVKTGQLKGITEIMEPLPAPIKALPPATSAPRKIPALTAKAMKSDIFSEEEKSLYATLLTLQNAALRIDEDASTQQDQ